MNWRQRINGTRDILVRADNKTRLRWTSGDARDGTAERAASDHDEDHGGDGSGPGAAARAAARRLAERGVARAASRMGGAARDERTRHVRLPYCEGVTQWVEQNRRCGIPSGAPRCGGRCKACSTW